MKSAIPTGCHKPLDQADRAALHLSHANEGRRTNDTRMVIKALAWYLHRGYPLEVHLDLGGDLMAAPSVDRQSAVSREATVKRVDGLARRFLDHRGAPQV